MAAEQQYLDILDRIRTSGTWEPTRQISDTTGEPVNAKTIMGASIILNPEDGFPLTTLRPMSTALFYFIGEMLWILSGSSQVSLLHKYGVKYWDPWVTKKMCERYELSKGDFGRTYGPQWRGFRTWNESTRTKTIYQTDQIRELFTNIQHNPTDRRMIVNAYHPIDSKHLNIRPCHGTFHVRVLGNKQLDMVVTQWSADMPVGVPSNLVMYRFLQYLLCLKFGLEVGTYKHDLHDTHYYSNQEAGVDILLSRKPKKYPDLILNPIFADVLDSLVMGNPDPLKFKKFNPGKLPYAEVIKDWITLEDYNPHPAIPRELLPVAI